MATRMLIWALAGAAALPLRSGAASSRATRPRCGAGSPSRRTRCCERRPWPGICPRARAWLPERGEGAVRFALPDGATEVEGAASWVPRGGRARGGRGVAYARPGGASFWSAGEAGYEEWLWLDADAVRRDAPRGGLGRWRARAWRARGEAVELLDASGAARRPFG